MFRGIFHIPYIPAHIVEVLCKPFEDIKDPGCKLPGNIAELFLCVAWYQDTIGQKCD